MMDFGQPLVMAIINVTPDSFYDGGKYSEPDDILRDAEEKVRLGAHILDIGAASSRPNAALISADEEWQRLKTILPLIRKRFPDTLISVDTWHAGVAEKSVAEGADIINDISGGDLDPDMFSTITRLNLPYIMMHMDGNPQTMTHNAPYEDVVKSVRAKMAGKTKQLESLGFNKIIIDPGFGFGKSLENNYQLLKGMEELRDIGYPVLAGVSRKSMINKVIGTNPVTALNGTTVLHTIALLNGASILRVHDVTEAVQAIALTGFYKNA